MLIFSECNSLKEANEFRKYLLSSIETFALFPHKIEHDTEINNNLLFQLLNVPIYSTNDQVGSIVTCRVYGGNTSWIWPKDTGIDVSSSINLSLPILENQHVVADFVIKRGTMKDHAYFAAINSIGIVEQDGAFFFQIECERKSIHLDMKNFKNKLVK